MDTYVEWMVKRKIDTPVRILRVMIMAVAALIGLVLLFLSLFISFLVFFGIIFFGLCIWGGIAINRRFSVEFEYIMTNFDLDIDKIIAQKKRKRLLSINLRTLQQFGPCDDAHADKIDRAGESKRIDVSAHDERQTYYFICTDKKNGRVLVFFTPDERIIHTIKAAAPQACQ